MNISTSGTSQTSFTESFAPKNSHSAQFQENHKQQINSHHLPSFEKAVRGGQFQYFRRGECPACSGARRDCRQNRSTGIVYCRDTQASPQGWQFVGEDSIGFYMWVEDEGNDRPQRSIEFQPRQHKQKAVTLSIQQRDRQFKIIARHSGLSLLHRAKLQERGLTREAINQAYALGMFWTWQSGATIPGIGTGLPGVDDEGKLRQYPPGFAVAVTDSKGKILGCQIRIDAPGSNGAKYLWVSSEKIGGSGIHLPNEEVPIGFYHPPAGQDSEVINLAEGFLKPLLIAQLHGVLCLGAAGANFAGSPQLFKEYLEAASTKLGTKSVVLNADAGSVSNPHVIGQYRKLWALAQEWGYQFGIRWWGQVKKAAGDADEISTEVFSTARLLSVEEFEAIVSKHLPEETAASWQDQYAKRARLAWEQSKQFTPTLEVEQQFVQIGAGVLAGADIHALRSTMATGKTQELARILGQSQSGVLAIGYRNSLLLQSCSRWGNFYHLHSDDAFGLIADPNSRIACCLDSLIHFKPSDFDGKILVLDEATSSIKHGLFSTTLKGKRNQVLELLAEAIKRAALVIAWDGNCCDIAVNYLAALRGVDCTVVKQLNRFQGDRLNVEFVQTVNRTQTDNGEISKPRLRDYSPMIRKIQQTVEESRLLPTEVARAIAIVSDSQTLCESMDNLLSSVGARVLRIDGRTVREDWAKQCLTNPNEFIQREHPDVVIISPTAESGFDVSIKNYFRHGFALFLGVVDTDTQCQMLRRFRDCLDWSVWCCEYTTIEEWEGTKSPFAQQLQAQLLDYLEADMRAALEGTDREQLAQNWTKFLQQQTDAPHVRAYLQFLAARNYERSHTRECLQIALENAGHHCKLVVLDQDAAARAEYKSAKDEVVSTHVRQIFHADTAGLDISWAIRVRSTFGGSQEDEYKAEKIMLLHRVPGIENTTEWSVKLVKELLFKDAGSISRLERYWFLKHMEAAKNKAIEQWQTLLEQGAFLGDVRSDYRYLQALDNLGILSLLERDEALSKDHIDVQRIYQRVKRTKSIQIALRRQPGKEPMAFIGRLMKSIGVTSRSVLLRSEGATRGYHYQAPSTDATTKTLLDCISRRLEKYLSAETAESPDISGVTSDHLPPLDNLLVEEGDHALNQDTSGFEDDRVNKADFVFPDWAGLPLDCQDDLQQIWEACESDDDRQCVVDLYNETRRSLATSRAEESWPQAVGVWQRYS
jgi:hypothetical protein